MKETLEFYLLRVTQIFKTEWTQAGEYLCPFIMQEASDTQPHIFKKVGRNTGATGRSVWDSRNNQATGTSPTDCVTPWKHSRLPRELI